LIEEGRERERKDKQGGGGQTNAIIFIHFQAIAAPRRNKKTD